ncbi:hypothetical protein Ddye_014066 [Dipteronia dyeriana]|uniref:Endonuclease/exonuclease/phosphatase domain-containing protein n=1 Tax=Dipteronia dyeriana TaxID=168575 RepID=A0AAD9X7E2_9ROSI|nr:hypothetical protein Ddye_014066 [Dipteronia dyeriana]
MIVLCWNVRELGNPWAFLALKRVIKRFSLNLVFLSETKLHNNEVERFRCVLGFEGALQVNSEGKIGGLILFWKDWDVSMQSFSKGHMDVKVKMNNGVLWRFSGFYGSPSQSNRAVSWELLWRLRYVDNLPWVCEGDFHEVLNTNDKQGGSDRPILNMVNFRKAIDDYDLIDVGFTGPKLT